MRKLNGLVTWLRARRAGWSGESDRAFHDTLFASHRHDPFSPAYTGNITIRRFADLAAPFVERCELIVDVGCGLGEITCELARRYPGSRFLGVDHSREGIGGARRNAERLELSNISFEVHDMETFTPDEDVDLVMMFDAFHHLLDPRAFISRMGKLTRRFLLIEPQGDWKGSWVRDLDFDWLARDLEKIRGHLAYAVAERPSSGGGDGSFLGSDQSSDGSDQSSDGSDQSSDGSDQSSDGSDQSSDGSDQSSDGRDQSSVDNDETPPGEARSATGSATSLPPPHASSDSTDAAEPVENRYSLEIFEEMFRGYGLCVRGTISGLDEYPPEPTLDTPTRREFGELAYQLYRSADDRLYESDLDLHAKHLVIYAEAGAKSDRRSPPAELPAALKKNCIRGAHDVVYLGYDGPKRSTAGGTFRATVRLRNSSFRVWSSDASEHPDFLSYHWLDEGRQVVVEDGLRNPLPRSLPPDEEIEVALRIETPARPGSYVLAIDLVQEGRTWFGNAGSSTLDVSFDVES